MANPRQALGSRGPGSTRLPSSMTPTASVGVISSACRNGSGSCTYRTCIGGGFHFLDPTKRGDYLAAGLPPASGARSGALLGRFFVVIQDCI